jgi:hypothetical protein
LPVVFLPIYIIHTHTHTLTHTHTHMSSSLLPSLITQLNSKRMTDAGPLDEIDQ